MSQLPSTGYDWVWPLAVGLLYVAVVGICGYLIFGGAHG